LKNNKGILSATISAEQRKAFMDEFGPLGEAYREKVYLGFAGEQASLDKSKLARFIDLVLEYFDQSIAGNLRMDGLYHSYNLIHFDDEGYAVEHLYEMLEGQVAVLSSGYQGPEESLQLLENLRASKIYRSDQNSYMLYPDRKQPGFLKKNVIPGSFIEGNHWIQKELRSGCCDYVEQDLDGKVHFNGRFRNAAELRTALDKDEDVSVENALSLSNIYEAVFEHRQFTGRSGSMFKYEGLGCIYWHMVSKLLLATSEVFVSACQKDVKKETINQLYTRYEEIKDGLGMHKSPAQYGAFPVDPYSHTPGFTGVQQPGMTGQVKEDVITRFNELGVKVSEGGISFAPTVLRRDEFLSEPETWVYSVGGPAQSEKVESGCMAFSLCAVPVIYRIARVSTIHVYLVSGESQVIPGKNLGQTWSQSLFEREKRIHKIVVDIPDEELK